jgi:N-acetylglucosamine malate deacetylase 1
MHLADTRVLVIAPHPDDEVLGAGGTIARAVKLKSEICVLTVAAHKPPLYSEEAHQTTLREAAAAHKVLGVQQSIFLDLPAVQLGQFEMADFNRRILNVVVDFQPATVLIPYPDRHVDHRVIFESAMVATRPVRDGRRIKLLAAYETLSETHWNAPHIEPNFTPNMCVDITETIEAKMAALKCYASQIYEYPGPRSLEAASALALFRGSQAGVGHGEAFQVIRLVI